MTNIEIYSMAVQIEQNFADGDKVWPAKAQFYLQKNFQEIMREGIKIQEERQKAENIEEFMKEERYVDIRKFSIEDLEGVKLSGKQMLTILPFIVEA